MNQNTVDNPMIPMDSMGPMDSLDAAASAPRRSALFQPLPLACITLGLLVLIESGTVPMLNFTMGNHWRVLLGAEGIALFFLGAMAAQKSRNDTLEERSLFRLYGLKAAAADDTFQDFKTAGPDCDMINHLWADAAKGSRVCAHLDTNGQFLRLEFLNGRQGRPCSICIRGKEHRALLKGPHHNYLCFEARVPKGEPRYTRPGAQEVASHPEGQADRPQRVKRVAITVRLVNGRLQHWLWRADSTETKQVVIEGPSWKQVRIPLEHSWKRFSAEGNPGGPSRPNFSVISAIIIEMGSEAADLPGEGYGNLDVRHFRCES